MFGTLTEQLQKALASLTGKAKISEDNIKDAVRDVRLALLDADVSYAVAKKIVHNVKEKAIGEKVISSVKPGQQFTKILHDELVDLMGKEPPQVAIERASAVWLLCGLQGAGKTTTCAKLARYYQKQGKKVGLVACDLQRPAAIDQLETLGKQLGAFVYSNRDLKDPALVAKEGIKAAKQQQVDLIIVDTSGRLHVDDDLMEELHSVYKMNHPDKVLFVANAATGQDAVRSITAFAQKMPLFGAILTMLDGSARAGAAISIRESAGIPILFEGTGEKIDDLQPFNPTSMADRILGMGDTINLVRKAQEAMSEQETAELEKKMRKASFTYEDFLKQMGVIQKMGSIKSLLSMIPGMGAMQQLDMADEQFKKVESIILSMTKQERRGEDELSPSRKQRVAKGSGTTLDDVNRLIKSFKQMKQFFKNIPNMKQLEKLMGGMKQWH